MYKVKFEDYDSYCQFEATIFQSYHLTACWDLIRDHLSKEKLASKAKLYYVTDRTGERIDPPIYIKVLQ